MMFVRAANRVLMNCFNLVSNSLKNGIPHSRDLCFSFDCSDASFRFFSMTSGFGVEVVKSALLVDVVDDGINCRLFPPRLAEVDPGLLFSESPAYFRTLDADDQAAGHDRSRI